MTATTKAHDFDWASWRRNSLPGQFWNLLYLAIACVCYWTWPRDFATRCATLSWDWVLPVFIRNLAITAAIYQFAHVALYVKKIAPPEKKFNPSFPSEQQHTRDRRLTLLSLTMGSCFEVWYMYALANNLLPWYGNYWDRPVLSVVSTVMVVIFRALHFYFVHRLLHPWRFKIFGVDPGLVLYQNFHSVHHKSSNPGPWSGLAMHPVESFLYYTSAMVHCLLPQHPLQFVFNKIHCDISPIPGHHGFDAYMGGKFHYLHHRYFEVNYGGSLIPLDAFFGTYRRD